jgi:hypothetical protein
MIPHVEHATIFRTKSPPAYNQMDPAQQNAVARLLAMRDTVLVGGAGTGKSHVTRAAIETISKSIGSRWPLILCATHTACAGYTNAVTISSFVKARGADIPSDPNDPRAVKVAARAFKLALNKQSSDARVIIVDEFALLGEQLPLILRWRDHKVPKAAVWLIGDLGQIVKHPAPWTFSEFPAFVAKAAVLYLTVNHRIAPDQPELRALLNHARHGTLVGSQSQIFWEQVVSTRALAKDTLILTAALHTAKARVAAAAKARGAPLHTVNPSRGGGPPAVFALGSKIMLTRATKDTAGTTHPQGTFAVVTAIANPDSLKTVQLELDARYTIGSQHRTNSGPKGTLVTTTSLDVVDAAALTVHRVQGATLAHSQVIQFEERARSRAY